MNNAAFGLLLVALLAGCQKNPAPGAQPVPAKPQEPQTAASVSAPATTTSATQASAPAAGEPELSAMKEAVVAEGLGIPVDLRYSFEGDPAGGHPVLLHLAAVPRVEGRNMSVSIKQVAGLRASGHELRENTVHASSAYRQQLSVLRDADGPTELRVLVTMDMPVGTGFSYFSVPLKPGGTLLHPAAEMQR